MDVKSEMEVEDWIIGIKGTRGLALKSDVPRNLRKLELPPLHRRLQRYRLVQRLIAFSRRLSFSFLLEGNGIDAFWLGIEALTGAFTGSEIDS
ncbi:hypothetical protein Tco_1136595 [Tanacetum coccineum]